MITPTEKPTRLTGLGTGEEELVRGLQILIEACVWYPERQFTDVFLHCVLRERSENSPSRLSQEKLVFTDPATIDNTRSIHLEGQQSGVKVSLESSQTGDYRRG